MPWFKRSKPEDQPQPIAWGPQEIMNNHLVHHLSGVVKFDCPQCKHETLAFNARWPVDSTMPVGFIGQEMRYTCIVCGKTFHKGEPAYEEVGGDNAH